MSRPKKESKLVLRFTDKKPSDGDFIIDYMQQVAETVGRSDEATNWFEMPTGRVTMNIRGYYYHSKKTRKPVA